MARALVRMAERIEFNTERLRLRQWCAADREPFASLNADPKVMEYYPSLLDRAASDAMADRCKSLIADRGWGFWAVELKKTNGFIGLVGLNIPTPELPFSPCVEVDQRTSRKDMIGVLIQSPIANLGVAESSLHDMKDMFHFGPDPGLVPVA